jgi:hypothetical protein
MSDAPHPSSRPVSLATILAILALFSLFGLLVCAAGARHRAPLPQDVAPENLPADEAWQATPERRAAYLAGLRAAQQSQAASYAWIDRKAGTIRLPIGRAMELVAERYGGKPSPAPAASLKP